MVIVLPPGRGDVLDSGECAAGAVVGGLADGEQLGLVGRLPDYLRGIDARRDHEVPRGPLLAKTAADAEAWVDAEAAHLDPIETQL
jgi:hypothetical protein